jgi:hypothetical protein
MSDHAAKTACWKIKTRRKWREGAISHSEGQIVQDEFATLEKSSIRPN